jgi:O-antigen/teichoic acid export membrane protein
MAPGRELRKALSNLSLKALSLGLERGCRFVVTIVAAPVLGQATFGRFAFASTVTALLALSTDLGLGLWTTRALARDQGDGARIVRVGMALRGLATLPYGLAVVAAAMLAGEPEVRVAIALLGVAALFNALADHVGAILRGYERFADEARLNGARALATTAAGLAALSFSRSLTGLCTGLAVAASGTCAYGLALTVRLHPFQELAGDLTIDRRLARSAVEQAAPIWIAGLLSLLYFKVDTLFVRAFAGDAELGAYAAAYKLFEGAHLVPAAVMAVTFPTLARANTDAPGRRRLERRLGSCLLALGLAVGGVCFVGGPSLVGWIFGPGFQRAAASLRVLALGVPLLYLNSGLTHFLVARNLERKSTWLALMMLAITVVLDVVLIPRRAGPGAALATVLAEVALTAACLAVLGAREAAARTRPTTQGSPRTDRTAA